MNRREFVGAASLAALGGALAVGAVRARRARAAPRAAVGAARYPGRVRPLAEIRRRSGIWAG
jgi:nitrous oxide reductase